MSNFEKTMGMIAEAKRRKGVGGLINVISISPLHKTSMRVLQ
jgi:hypothetical protein